MIELEQVHEYIKYKNNDKKLLFTYGFTLRKKILIIYIYECILMENISVWVRVNV